MDPRIGQKSVNVPLVLGTIALAWFIKRCWGVWAAWRAIGSYPGTRIRPLPQNIFVDMLGRATNLARLLSFEQRQKWEEKYSLFSNVGWDVIAIASPLSSSPIELLTADPVSIKAITGNRTLFPKPLEQYGALMLYGTNLVATDGDIWSRQRRLVNPSFNETSIRHVWEETVRIVNEMFDDWGEESETQLNNTCALTSKIALTVIGAVAFGQTTHWKTQSSPPPKGHQMHFYDAIKIVADKTLLRLVLPPFVWGTKETRDRVGLGGIASTGWLGSTVKKTAVAFAELELYMEEMIDERTTGGFEGRRDIMGQLMQASGEDASDRLSKRDVIGNTFIFLFAGHETTAHSVAFLFGLLALDQDEQEALYSHIESVLGDRDPVYDDLNSLSLVLGAFYESLRLYCPIMNIPKVTAEDTSIPVMPAVNEDGNQIDPSAKQQLLFVAKDTRIYLHPQQYIITPDTGRTPMRSNRLAFWIPTGRGTLSFPFLLVLGHASVGGSLRSRQLRLSRWFSNTTKSPSMRAVFLPSLAKV